MAPRSPECGVFTATIDGQTHPLPEGISLLEAIRRVGGDLPTLCWDERVEATGGCRLCSVEVAGAPPPGAGRPAPPPGGGGGGGEKPPRGGPPRSVALPP